MSRWNLVNTLVLVHCDLSELLPQRHGLAVTLLQLSEEISGCLLHVFIAFCFLIHFNINLQQKTMIRTFLNDFYEYILSFSSQTRFSINSPQTSAARDSVLVSPDSQIGQNQLPVSLQPDTADIVQRWGAVRSQQAKGTTGLMYSPNCRPQSPK